MSDVETLMSYPKETLVNMILMMRKKERAYKEKLGIALPPAAPVALKPAPPPAAGSNLSTSGNSREQRKEKEKQSRRPEKSPSRKNAQLKAEKSGEEDSEHTAETWISTVRSGSGPGSKRNSDDGYFHSSKLKDPSEVHDDKEIAFRVDEHHYMGCTIPTISISAILSESPQFKKSLQQSSKEVSFFLQTLFSISETIENTAKKGYDFAVGVKKFSEQTKKLKSAMINAICSDALSKITELLDLVSEETIQLMTHFVNTFSVGVQNFAQHESNKVQECYEKYQKSAQTYENYLKKYSKKISARQSNRLLDDEKEKIQNELNTHVLEYSNILNRVRTKDSITFLENMISVVQANHFHQKKVIVRSQSLSQYFQSIYSHLTKAKPTIAEGVSLKEESLHNQPKFVLDKTNPSFSGYLMCSRKDTPTQKEKLTWHLKYFVLKCGQLQKMEIDKSGTLARTRYELLTSSIKPTPTHERAFVFEFISMTKQGPQNLLLQALNHADFTLWNEAITQGILMAMSHMKEDTGASARPKSSLPPSEAEILLKRNPFCSDCGTPNPDWTSINLGVMFCIECSGAHRSLGVHVSKCRSLTIDNFDPTCLQFLKSVSNDMINAVLEETLPQDPKIKKITSNASRTDREEFIRNKYIKKAWVKETPDANWNRVLLSLDLDEPFAALEAILRGANPNIIDDHKASALQRAEEKHLGLVTYVLLMNGAKAKPILRKSTSVPHHLQSPLSPRRAILGSRSIPEEFFLVSPGRSSESDSEGHPPVVISKPKDGRSPRRFLGRDSNGELDLTSSSIIDKSHSDTEESSVSGEA